MKTVDNNRVAIERVLDSIEATVKFLYPGELTPVAKTMLDRAIERERENLQ